MKGHIFTYEQPKNVAKSNALCTISNMDSDSSPACEAQEGMDFD
jgi:hypothetical protein